MTLPEDDMQAAGGEGLPAASTMASTLPLTLEEKEAVISSRAEENRSAVRRTPLGWDRYVAFGVIFFFRLSDGVRGSAPPPHPPGRPCREKRKNS